MKVLFVVEQGNAPSIRLRLLDCLERYRGAGIEPTVLVTHSNLANRLRVIREAARHRVVVIFKAIGFTAVQLQLLKRANPRLVFDFDDAVMFREAKYDQPLRARTFHKFLRTIDHCVAVVAGNDYLRAFAEAGDRRVLSLPTPVDLAKYSVKEHAECPAPVIGWIGLSDGFVHLRGIASPLREVARAYPQVRLKVVSDKVFELDAITVDNEPWRLEAEQAALGSFDVGIMPLRDTAYTRGKGGYKILQYMAAGVPPVASPVGINRDLIQPGTNGYLASADEQWSSALSELIGNAETRRVFGARGRQLVERAFTLDDFARAYIDLLSEVAHT